MLVFVMLRVTVLCENKCCSGLIIETASFKHNLKKKRTKNQFQRKFVLRNLMTATEFHKNLFTGAVSTRGTWEISYITFDNTQLFFCL